MTIDLSTLTIAQARKALDAKEYSALDLTNAYLDEIAKKDGEIHAYLEVWADSAREEAQLADAMIAAGTQKALTGIPLAIKDNLLIKGRVASAASKMLENYRASYDATVIAKLKAHGVVFLGRANMDEFAMGSSTENSAYGPSRNPHDLSRVPGGSSGGSAAAVAGNLALAALGTDTGGSIRQPAALTGIVGLKTTYGAVSRYGAIAMGSSLDQIGPLTKTVADARVLYEAIRGADPYDSTTLPDTMPAVQMKTKRLGVPRSFLTSGVNPDVMERFEESLKKLEKAGYTIVDVDLPNIHYSLAVYYVLMPAEVSTNLARFDGIRYGLSVPGDSIAEVYAKSRAKGFGPETRRRIILGTFVLSSGYADAYYRKAKSVRALITQDFIKAFEQVDAIVMPTTTSPAFTFGSKADPLSMYLEDIFTVPVNLAGVPGISVPMGTVVRDGVTLPVGLQIVGPHKGEDILFSIGEVVQQSGI